VPGTGWQRLLGSPKLQIIFHKNSTKYRSLLREMIYKDKGSYESLPPCSDIRHLLSLVPCVAVCCRVLQRDAVCCSVLQCVAERCSDTGWRRLTGSPRLQIISNKRATKYRSLLRKITYKDKGSYESSPRCIRHLLSFVPCVAVCCSVLPCVAVCCSVLPCVAECCSVLQSVAV